LTRPQITVTIGTMSDLERLITKGQLAKELNVSIKTISRYMKKGMPVIYVGRLPRFKYYEVLDWFTNFKPVKGGEKNDRRENNNKG